MRKVWLLILRLDQSSMQGNCLFDLARSAIALTVSGCFAPNILIKLEHFVEMSVLKASNLMYKWIENKGF